MYDPLECELVSVKVGYVRSASRVLMQAECEQIVAHFISAYNQHFQKKKWWHKFFGMESSAIKLTTENTGLLIRSNGLDLEWIMPKEAEKNLMKEYAIICEVNNWNPLQDLRSYRYLPTEVVHTTRSRHLEVYERANKENMRSRVLYEDIYAKNDDSVVELSADDIEFLSHSGVLQ